MKERVRIVQDGVILWLTLTRPERLNALDEGMRDAIVEGLANASGDASIRAVVITGEGNHAFCAGQDLNESAALDQADGDRWMAGWRRFFAGVAACEKPIVAALNGTAAGAGLQLALLADIRIAMPTSHLLMAEVNVCLPAIVGSYLLDLHLGQSRMRDLVLTGRRFTALEARDWGLVHEICEEDTLGARAANWAGTLAAKPPIAMNLTRSFLRSLMGSGLGEAEVAAADYQAKAIATGEPQRVMEKFFADRRAKTANAS